MKHTEKQRTFDDNKVASDNFTITDCVAFSEARLIKSEETLMTIIHKINNRESHVEDSKAVTVT